MAEKFAKSLVFKQLLVIEDLAAWTPNIRSKAAIRTTRWLYATSGSMLMHSTARCTITATATAWNVMRYFICATAATHYLR